MGGSGLECRGPTGTQLVELASLSDDEWKCQVIFVSGPCTLGAYEATLWMCICDGRTVVHSQQPLTSLTGAQNHIKQHTEQPQKGKPSRCGWHSSTPAAAASTIVGAGLLVHMTVSARHTHSALPTHVGCVAMGV